MSDLAALYAAVLGLPGGDRVGVYAVATAELDERGAGVVFSEDRDDLRLGEARIPLDGFLSALWPENPPCQVAPITGAASAVAAIGEERQYDVPANDVQQALRAIADDLLRRNHFFKQRH
jgi:hypothetical protein